MTSCSEVFTDLQKRLDAAPNKTAGMNATFQFNLSGDGGGNWFLKITDGKAEIAEGTAPSANTTINMTASDYVDMSTGKLSGQQAFFSGKMKVTGDAMLGMKLGQITAP